MADRTNTKVGYRASSIVLAGAALGLLRAEHAAVAVTFGLTALAGAGYAGCQLFPLAMLPDTANDATSTGDW